MGGARGGGGGGPRPGRGGGGAPPPPHHPHPACRYGSAAVRPHCLYVRVRSDLVPLPPLVLELYGPVRFVADRGDVAARLRDAIVQASAAP